jgi:hypothetical protein
VGRVLRLLWVERELRVLPARLRRRERAGGDHLAVVYAAFPLGKPGGMVYPVALKNGCAWVDAVVDDPDLDSVPGGAERGRAHIWSAPISCGLRSSSGR